jgi:hypothetical protein
MLDRELRDLRYVEGRNIILEFRFAGRDLAQGRRLAAELVAAPVDAIVIPIVAVRPRFGQRRSAGDAV